MGKRSGVLDHEEAVLKLSLNELDAEIARCRSRLAIAPSKLLQKSFAKRIHWLTRLRARHREILAGE
jgi:hypothetical protein